MEYRQVVLSRIEQLQQQIDELREYILHQENNSSRKSGRKEKTPEIHLYQYQTSFSWQEKIVFVLNYRKKPLLSSEIVSFLDEFDTVFQYKHTELDKQKMLSTHLNRAIQKKIIRRFKKPGIRGYYYALNSDPGEYLSQD